MDDYKPIGGPYRVLYLLIGFIICSVIGSTNFTMAVKKGQEENDEIEKKNSQYKESDLCVVEKVTNDRTQRRHGRQRRRNKTFKFNLDNCSKKVKNQYITGITFLCITFIILIILLFIFIKFSSFVLSLHL